MSDQQLERSVLEAKDREELFAIAEALGSRPTTRARKGDLVTSILRATGVEVADEPDPPRRTRARKAAAPTVDPPAPPVDTPAPVETPALSDAAGSATGPARSGSVPVAPEPSTAAHAGSGAGEPATAEGPLRGAVPPDPGPPSGTPSRTSDNGQLPFEGGSTTARPRLGTRTGPGPAEGSGRNRPGATANPSGSARTGVPDSAVPVRPGGRPSGATGPGPTGPTDSPAPFRRNQRTGGGQSGSPQSGSSQSGSPQSGSLQSGLTGSSPAVSGQGGSSQGGSGQHGSGQGGSGQGGSGQGGSGTNGSATAGGVTPGAGEQDHQGADGSDRSRFEGEGGNRRNRRRRGRDRTDRPERELTGQGGADAPFNGEPIAVVGYLDLRDEGYGFLRTEGFSSSDSDVYVSISQVRRFSLRRGDWLEGTARPASATEKYPAMLRIDTVSGASPEEARMRPRFDELVPIAPEQPIPLSGDDPNALALRVMDLMSPIGRGQRGLLTGPPRSGKTAVLTEVVQAIESRHPDLELFVVVIDERPEAVTEVRRAVRTDVIATTFDRPAEDHVQVAELVVERAKRLVETGKDVVVVIDGLTRLARAYNLVPAGTGRVLPGGIDAGALHHPKRFFAAARNIEGTGSLTMLATALVDTGSRTDEVIYEELSPAANMELRLDGRLAGHHLYPAIDVKRSSNRYEERLLDGDTLEQVRTLRQVLDPAGAEDSNAAVESFLERLATSKTNQEFLTETARNPASGA